jgi:hypothetical protein
VVFEGTPADLVKAKTPTGLSLLAATRAGAPKAKARAKK